MEAGTLIAIQEEAIGRNFFLNKLDCLITCYQLSNFLSYRIHTLGLLCFMHSGRKYISSIFQ